MVKLVCIVEGDGDVEALPVLLRRIRDEYQRFDVVIERPLRSPRDRFLNRPEEMSRMLAFAAGRAGPDGCILVLLDADDDCVAELVARYQADVTRLAGATDCGLVFAKSEFESWFVAGVESLHGFHRIPDGLSAPVNPEDIRDAKGWLRRNMEGQGVYSETVDQPAFAARFDWRLARRRSASMDKLCRELARLLGIDELATMNAA